MDNTEQAYIVWPFDKAPQEYQDLSTAGGDEDWVVLIPRGGDDCPSWFRDIGVCSVEYYTTTDGRRIAIGQHA